MAATLSAHEYNTEKELLMLVAAGDEAAYKILFRQYWDQIYSTAIMFTKSPELAEDLTQDVFARIWIKREKLAEVEKFSGYLFIMARNIVFDRLKKEVYTSGNADFFESYFDKGPLTPNDKIELKELEQIIEKGIENLPPQQQRTFRLSRFNRLTHEQIAAEMGISRLTVKSNIMRAVQSLRKYIDNHTDSLPVIIWIILFL